MSVPVSHPKLTLHDLYGVPFHIVQGSETFLFAPPTVLFFEKLLQQYNLKAVDIESNNRHQDALHARFEVLATVMKMMHVSLSLGEPDGAWTLDRVADLIQRHPSIIEAYMEAFKSYMPRGGVRKKS